MWEIKLAFIKLYITCTRYIELSLVKLQKNNIEAKKI